MVELFQGCRLRYPFLAWKMLKMRSFRERERDERTHVSLSSRLLWKLPLCALPLAGSSTERLGIQLSIPFRSPSFGSSLCTNLEISQRKWTVLLHLLVCQAWLANHSWCCCLVLWAASAGCARKVSCLCCRRRVFCADGVGTPQQLGSWAFSPLCPHKLSITAASCSCRQPHSNKSCK